MRTLASIIKQPRRIARDATGRPEFADADEYFDGGIKALEAFLSENICDGDLETLMEGIRIVLHLRVRDAITGPVAGGALDSRSTTGFASRYPSARNIRRLA